MALTRHSPVPISTSINQYKRMLRIKLELSPWTWVSAATRVMGAGTQLLGTLTFDISTRVAAGLELLSNVEDDKGLMITCMTKPDEMF